MKKIVIYFLCMVLFCFLIPIVFTKKHIHYEKEVVTEQKDEIEFDEYDYKELDKVKLLHVSTRRN